MKKALLIWLMILALFFSFSIGIWFGRRNISGEILIQTETQTSEVLSSSEPSINEGKININTASVSQLALLPGIGEILASRIVDYRERNGAFTTIEQLQLVDGIGEKRLEELLDYITVGG